MVYKRSGKPWLKKQKSAKKKETPCDDQKQQSTLSTDLHENLEKVRKSLGESSDLVIRTIRIGQEKEITIGVISIEGLIDTQVINDHIMVSLVKELKHTDLHPDNEQHIMDALREIVLTVCKVDEVNSFDTLFSRILSGNTVILLDGFPQGFSANTSGGLDRGVSEPSTGTVIRGPREGFSERLRTNTALIRRKIKDPDLWMETIPIGQVTKTDVAIMYIKGIVNDKVVEEVRRRLKRIEIDGILESGYIEELIQDETYTPFPTIYNTELPDIAAANLLEGRVAILVDGTPFVLLAPALFVQFYQSAEDYYQRSDFASAIRLLRLFSLLISLLAPSLYIAITTFHHEMIPNTLLVSIAAQREGVPFPAFMEALMMEVTFEILREAGIRMPRAVGQAVSIVGTLVIGLAGVEAGLVSAAMVIIVAITAISSFVFPSPSMSISIRLLRFPLMGLAASFGLLGVTVGLIFLTVHLSSLRSFGIPYMSPVAPFIREDLKDTLWRLPWWGLTKRPRLISQKNIKRQASLPSPKPEPRQ